MKRYTETCAGTAPNGSTIDVECEVDPETVAAVLALATTMSDEEVKATPDYFSALERFSKPHTPEVERQAVELVRERAAEKLKEWESEA